MAFSINDFKARGFTDGGARPTLFEVIVPSLPQIVGEQTGISGVSVPDKVTLNCKASSLPPSIISEVEVGYFGRKIKVIGDRTFPNWSTTIYNMEDFLVRNLFENWQEIMNSRQPNLLHPSTPVNGASNSATDPNNYKRDITVIQYSKAGAEKRYYTLIGAFPVSIAPIGLDWDATNQIELFDVDWAYDYWEPTLQNEGTTIVPTPSITLNPGL